MTAPALIGSQWSYALAALLFGAGMWLLLPRGSARGRWLGAGVCAVGLALLTLLVHCGMVISRRDTGGFDVAWAPALAKSLGLGEDLVFLSLATVTVASAVASVTFRKPVYCAIWFALCLMGVAGLFLYQGAQFLGVATIVVYAGAILVTILFVLMLAQPEGHAYYDRLSWEAALSSVVAAVLVGLLTITTASALQPQESEWIEGKVNNEFHAQRESNILSDHHMAGIGRELFSKNLIAVEVAGTLLLVALVGAVAIAYQSQVERSLAGEPADRTPRGRAHG